MSARNDHNGAPKLLKVSVHADLVEAILQEGWSPPTRIRLKNGIPPDAKLVHVSFRRNTEFVELVFETSRTNIPFEISPVVESIRS